MDEIDVKVALIQDRLKHKEISLEEYHQECDKIFGIKKGFFVNLKSELENLASNQISMKSRDWLTSNRYLNLLAKKIDETIENYDWVEFWLRYKGLHMPLDEDLETLKHLGNYQLANIHEVLCYSLKQQSDNDLEYEETAQILHEYYKLTKNEINSRESMPQLPPKDAFLDYIAHKKEHGRLRNLLKGARKSGEICVHCHSRNVISYNKLEWQCKDCKRRFRKH